jgi:CheY-like chemotaxis protein
MRARSAQSETESAGSRMVTACLQPGHREYGKSIAGNSAEWLFVQIASRGWSPALGEGQRELEMNGLRVLVVEDSEFLAELIEDMLTDAGAIVVGWASSVAAALDELRGQSVDLVCLDIMLGPELSFAIADALTVQGIPFVFVTACDPAIVPDRHRRQPLIDKMDLVTQLVATCSAARTLAASPA